MTQKELADAIGMSTGAIVRYEKGQRIPKPEIIERIAITLGANPSAFIPFDEWEEKYNADGKLAKDAAALDYIHDTYGNNAVKFLEMFTELTEQGQQELMHHFELLFKVPEYRKTE